MIYIGGLSICLNLNKNLAISVFNNFLYTVHVDIETGWPYTLANMHWGSPQCCFRIGVGKIRAFALIL